MYNARSLDKINQSAYNHITLQRTLVKQSRQYFENNKGHNLTGIQANENKTEQKR